MLKIEMLSTGDEVLHGQIVDTNAAWLADFFFQHGLPLSFRSTAGDELNSLVNALLSRSQQADILIVNGGLGPTTDDLSAQAAAMANNETLVEHPEWMVKIEQFFAQRGSPMPASNRKQAILPASAELVDNPVGTACGFMMSINQCLVFFTPGVPSEFKVMVESQILPLIRQRFTLPAAPVCWRLTTIGCAESALASLLDPIPLPTGCVIGYRSSMPIIELKLTGPAAQTKQMQPIWEHIKQLVENNILFEGTLGIAHLISQRLIEQNCQLMIAEQFTGGLINYQLNSVQAPIIAGEVMPSQPSDVDTFIKYSSELKNRYQADIYLSVGGFSENRIHFMLVTPKKNYTLTFNYTHRQLPLAEMQATIACAAQDMLNRYLCGKDIMLDYEWLKLSAYNETNNS